MEVKAKHPLRPGCRLRKKVRKRERGRTLTVCIRVKPTSAAIHLFIWSGAHKQWHKDSSKSVHQENKLQHGTKSWN